MIDSRRESNQVARHFNRYQNTIGEGAIWFIFDADRSAYDRVYDEAYRRYERGRKVPMLWVDQQEAPADYSPEGRRPTQRIRLAFGAQALWEAGVKATEVHGTSLSDQSPSEVWTRDRLNDIVYYQGHFYAISAFHIKGRVKDQDVIVGVTGIEIFPEDELNLDVTPRDWFAPLPEPSVPTPIYDNRTHVFVGQDQPDDPRVGEFWFTPLELISEYALDSPVPYGAIAPDPQHVGDLWLDTEPED